MATGVNNFPGSKVPYHFTKFDDALANNGTIVIDHANDPNKIRSVRVINRANGRVVPIAASNAQVDYTSDTQTTITNLTGGAVNWLGVVTVNP